MSMYFYDDKNLLDQLIDFINEIALNNGNCPNKRIISEQTDCMISSQKCNLSSCPLATQVLILLNRKKILEGTK